MYQEILERNKQIYLNEEEHKYSLINSIIDIDFQSVTEFIGEFFHPFNELKVATKLVQHIPKYSHLSVDDLLRDWEQRRNRGTKVHKEIENFINLKESKVDSDLKTMQGIKFLNQKCIKDTNLLFSEIKIFSKTLKIAGTIDLMIYNKEKNHISLIDWKTNEKIKKNGYTNGIVHPVNDLTDSSFNRYSLQLSMYKYILEEFYSSKVNGLFIIHLKDDNYNIIQCDYKQYYIEQMIKYVKS